MTAHFMMAVMDSQPPGYSCKCGFACSSMATIRAHLADVSWALADRAADDRAADLQGIERVIALAERPVPAELLTAREKAAIALREACVAEGDAEQEMKEAARQLMEVES